MTVPKLLWLILQHLFRTPCEYDPEAAPGTPSFPPSPPCSQTTDSGTNSSSEDRGSQSSLEESSPAQSESEQTKDKGDAFERTSEKPLEYREKRGRIEILKDILEPILGPENGESCVLLLCCGSPSACRVLPVPIPISSIPMDYVGQWSLIKDSWNTFHKNWRHRLPFYGIKQVSLASVSLLAQTGSSRSNSDGHSQFLGACTPEDLEGQMQQQQAIIDQVPERVYTCYYDPQLLMFEHHEECDNHRESHETVFEPYESSYRCPFEEIREAKRKLLELSRRKSFLNLAFQCPELSDANKLLPGELFYSHLDVLRLCDEWVCPSLYELPFRGLIIEEGWLLPFQSVFLICIGGLLMLAVPLRFMFGGWDASWGAASCLVTMAMFGYQYAKDQPRH